MHIELWNMGLIVGSSLLAGFSFGRLIGVLDSKIARLDTSIALRSHAIAAHQQRRERWNHV